MDYLSVEEARDLSGLKLVLTGGVPGPWSEAAKALFNHHQVPFHPVQQVGGQSNDALVAWTSHRNAPVAVWNDEAPRKSLLEIFNALGPTDDLAIEGRKKLSSILFS